MARPLGQPFRHHPGLFDGLRAGIGAGGAGSPAAAGRNIAGTLYDGSENRSGGILYCDCPAVAVRAAAGDIYFLFADGKLEEMAQVFHMSLWNRIRCIYVPALRPYCLSACRAALGLCWKAGVAAEVIGVSGGSMGGMLYDAKVYLELDSLFAWTAAIVMASVAFEWCFLRLIDWVFRWIEGK